MSGGRARDAGGGGGSRPLHLLQPSSGWGWGLAVAGGGSAVVGGGGAGMRTAKDHEQPIPQTATEQKLNSFKDFIWSNNGISNSI